ncbi:unnamed protein product [Prorocentrum cordatum]|uniref:Uncharacterized protein n=1 Tax=Prorocentrum cordatum TaxID=2364126 RepID=A0ABN9WPQ6_9DINO|nr:unnamed protein product [Polarella glacialis]
MTGPRNESVEVGGLREQHRAVRSAHGPPPVMSCASLGVLTCCRGPQGAADGLVVEVPADLADGRRWPPGVGPGAARGAPVPPAVPARRPSAFSARVLPGCRGQPRGHEEGDADEVQAAVGGGVHHDGGRSPAPTMAKSATFESRLSASSSATPPGEASRDRLRDRTRRLRRSVSRPFAQTLRRHLSWRVAIKKVPVLKAVPNCPPLISDTFPGVGLEDVRDAFVAAHGCVTSRHLAAHGCHDVRDTGWRPCPDNEGHLVRKIVCMVPVPPDAAPPAVARLLGVPKALQATMVQRLCTDADMVTLVEQSYTKDVVYLDRFMTQYVRRFSPNSDGGVDMRLWVETVWTRDLPFTHFAVKSFVEKKTRSEATTLREEYKHIVQSSAMECRNSRPLRPRGAFPEALPQERDSCATRSCGPRVPQRARRASEEGELRQSGLLDNGSWPVRGPAAPEAARRQGALRGLGSPGAECVSCRCLGALLRFLPAQEMATLCTWHGSLVLRVRPRRVLTRRGTYRPRRAFTASLGFVKAQDPSEPMCFDRHVAEFYVFEIEELDLTPSIACHLSEFEYPPR